jgi:hypothetical protein
MGEGEIFDEKDFDEENFGETKVSLIKPPSPAQLSFPAMESFPAAAGSTRGSVARSKLQLFVVSHVHSCNLA